MDQPDRVCPQHGNPMTKLGRTNTVYFVTGEPAVGWDYACPQCAEETGELRVHTYLAANPLQP
jgi:phage host-nuclease inhibitor protein Gam